MRAVVLTLGCKINQCESDSLAYLLRERGYEVDCRESQADLFLVNTCAVTAEADRKSRQTVHRIAKHNPDADILVFGCSAQHARETFADMNGVVAVGGTYDKVRIVTDYLNSAGSVDDYFAFEPSYVEYPPQAHLKTREYVKVQDGCNNFCSYCIIPYVRGRSRSRSADAILEQIERSTAKEIVLTGIDLSSYGRDIGTDLAELLEQVKHPRVRLGSLEPMIITDRLLAVMRSDRFCKHFHLSMQSCSDRVLRAMNRHYTAEEYIAKTELIRSYFPEANLTTDCIAGFPTETLTEHGETLANLERIRFGDMHVFPYSVREGTRAAKFAQVPKAERTRRAHEMISAAERHRETYLASRRGTVATVLTEQDESAGVTGYTELYIKTVLPHGTPLNELVRVRIGASRGDGTVDAEPIDGGTGTTTD